VKSGTQKDFLLFLLLGNIVHNISNLASSQEKFLKRRRVRVAAVAEDGIEIHIEAVKCYEGCSIAHQQSLLQYKHVVP
jgi:hypothetical protein